MKKILIILALFAAILASCERDLSTSTTDATPIPGVVGFELRPGVNFIKAAYLITDTFYLPLAYSKYVDYKLDTPSAAAILDSIIKSKTYFTGNYAINSIGSSSQTVDLHFYNLLSAQAHDWDTTMIKYNISQVINFTNLPTGYINVPAGQEEEYIEKLEQHPWFIKKAFRVYGTIVDQVK